MTDTTWIPLDLLLAALLLGLGWASVAARDPKRGVALFIAFGLLLAVTWARLRAPDLAMAEAAIGAGVAGALLLAALRREDRVEPPGTGPSGPRLWLLNLFCLGLAAAVGWALLDAMAGSDGTRLAELAGAHIAHSGVSNPVTAVLLNFRAYDTLLELAVVLAAVLGVLSLGPARPGFEPAGPVLGSLVRLLLPLLIVTAGYLLWVGAHAPGGAFQAGATLAAAAVLLRLGGRAEAGLPAAGALRWLLIAGIALFVVVGLAVIGPERAFLQYPPGWAGALILLIETAATLSIAVALALAYIGGRPKGWEPASHLPLAPGHREDH
jgi:multisubunit Na+/H+ antiporter MnhB subunit